jgi:outer membrane receptor for ferrienterochelin and colicins
VRDVTVTARSFYDGVVYEGTYIYGAGPSRVKNQDLGPSDWFGSELRARWDAPARHGVTAGAEFTYHPDATQRNFDLPSRTTFLDDHRTYDTWGVYGQDEWLVLPTLTLVGGLRFDSYYDRLRELSPRLAAIWTPRPESTLKLLYGRAFRPPNLYEQYYSFSGAGLQSLANPRLDSEKITTYEAVFEQGLWGKAEGVVALYRYDIDGLIDQTTVGGGSGSVARLQYRNLNSVTANGAELELRVPLPKGIRARASYAIQDATSEGRDLTNSPHNLGSGGVLFPLPLGVEGGADLVIVGPRRTLGGRTLGTVNLLDLTLRSPTPVPRLRVAGSVYNLLDQRYFDPGAAEHRQDRIRQDGLTFRVQLEYAF